MGVDFLKDGNWREAFGFAGQDDQSNYAEPSPAYPLCEVDCSPFGVEDVKEVFGSREGENEGENWKIAGRLKDGRFFYLEAGCDYTGWD